MQSSCMDRKTTTALKGIALVFMFLHHFFTFPDWYVDGISYPAIAPFVRFLRTPLDICVVIFAFLTGYFYHFAGQKTYRYSLRKITDLLVSYWAVYIPLLILAVVLGCQSVSLSGFVAELLALERPVMYFCWYVYFYYVSMLLLPVLVRMSSGSLTGDIFLLLVLPVALFTVLLGVLEYEFGIDSHILVEILGNMREWFPCIVMGYLCAKYDLFATYLDGLSEKLRPGVCRVLFWLCLCGISFFGRLICPRFTLGSVSVAGVWIDLTFTMDILYGPLFVYGAAKILNMVKAPILIKPLQALGKQSLLMWFLHCVFFNCCKEYTQPVLYFLKNPVLVLVFGLGVCYLAALLIDIPLQRALKLKNRLFQEKNENTGKV